VSCLTGTGLHGTKGFRGTARELTETTDLEPATRPDRPADLGRERFTIESSTPQGRCEDHADKAVNTRSVRQPTVKRWDPLPLAPNSTRTITEAGDRTDKAKGQGRWLWNDRWGQNNLHGLRT
jgi:hypothetical protein